ncbi:UNVERIFIED_CONTAM: hypothetical protein GTU68_052956, partial [Idotea baltica]|nr:hypothetical protein [Idotea baltica]
MDKYELVPQQLLHEGTVTKENFFHPSQLSEEEILLTHTKGYYNRLHALPLGRKEERAIGFPIRSDLIERGKYIARGTLECAYHAMESGVSLNVAGGTHHAFADRGEGFCIFNDFAIASNLLLAKGDVGKILIVDLDVHQGNGTAKIFEKEDRVFTFSMHGAKNYPVRKEVSDLDIGLPDGCEDGLFLKTLEDTLPKLIDKVKPSLIFYLSGVDVLAVDKLGRLGMTLAGCKQRDEILFAQANKKGIPVAVSMGGGYAEKISDIIEAHSNTFRVAFDI